MPWGLVEVVAEGTGVATPPPPPPPSRSGGGEDSEQDKQRLKEEC